MVQFTASWTCIICLCGRRLLVKKKDHMHTKHMSYKIYGSCRPPISVCCEFASNLLVKSHCSWVLSRERMNGGAHWLCLCAPLYYLELHLFNKMFWWRNPSHSDYIPLGFLRSSPPPSWNLVKVSFNIGNSN